jgi:hypothetical protein
MNESARGSDLPASAPVRAAQDVWALENLDLSEAEKCELLQALWDLLIAIADLKLGLDPLHTLHTLLGTDQQNTSEFAEIRVKLDDNIQRDFADNAAQTSAAGETDS